MSDRKKAAAAAEEAIPDELLYTEEDYIHEQRQEHRRKHVVLWFATAGTLAFVGALWFLLLPGQFGGAFSVGAKRGSTWTATGADSGDAAKSFSNSVDGIKSQLDRIEQAEQKNWAQQDAVQAETARLKASIEAANNANANAAPAAAPPANATK